MEYNVSTGIQDLAEFFNEESDAEVIAKLRQFGVAVIVANYRGGSDQAYYDLEQLLDEERNPLLVSSRSGDVTEQQKARSEKLRDYLQSLDWDQKPECIACDQYHGGYFSGAGDGRSYGGTVEMRLDTLQTRKVGEYWQEEIHESYPEAPFT